MKFLDISTQNLDFLPGDDYLDASGSILRHGRAWIRRHSKEVPVGFADKHVYVEWFLGFQAKVGGGLKVTDEHGPYWLANLYTPVGSLHLSAPTSEGVLAFFRERIKDVTPCSEYETVAIAEVYADADVGWLRWQFMHPPDYWRRGTPWWRHGSLTFGRAKNIKSWMHGIVSRDVL